jgi:hypothetical protein
MRQFPAHWTRSDRNAGRKSYGGILSLPADYRNHQRKHGLHPEWDRCAKISIRPPDKIFGGIPVGSMDLEHLKLRRCEKIGFVFFLPVQEESLSKTLEQGALQSG